MTDVTVPAVRTSADVASATTAELSRAVKIESRRIVTAIRDGASLSDIKLLADRAEALRLLARKAGVNLEYQNEAAYARLVCEREGGRMLGENPEFGRGKKSVTVTNLEIDHNRSKRWQKEAAIPSDVFEGYVELVNEKGDELTGAGVRALANRLAGGKGVVQSLTNEWYTPATYVEAARKVLGGVIDLDPASCAEANEVIQADQFFTEEDDGLLPDWHGRVWLNPPYGRIAGDFVARLVDQHAAGNVSAAITLVNAHCTDTRWFQLLWDHTLCFTDHRIDFHNGTEERSGSTHGSVFVYLGDEYGLFAQEFGEFGAVVRRYP